MNSSVGSSQPKASHDKLRKTSDGNNYVKWLDKLKDDFSTNSAVSVKQFGPDLLHDQTSFQARFALRSLEFPPRVGLKNRTELENKRL